MFAGKVLRKIRIVVVVAVLKKQYRFDVVAADP